MSAGLSFGALPAFADLSPDQQAMVMQSLQARASEQQQPGSPDQLLFNRASMGGGPNGFQPPEDGGPAQTGAVGREAHQSAPMIAMDEAAVQRMEQPMLPPTAGGNVPPVPQAAPTSQGGPVPPAMPQPSLGGAQPAPQAAPQASVTPQGAPQAVSPTAAAQASGQAGAGGGMFDKFLTGLQNPQVSDLLLNLGIGLMSQRGIGQGLAAGLQGYQGAQSNSLKQQLQQLQIQQQLQGQQATRAYLQSKGLSGAAVEATTLNPAILSSSLSQMNQKTPEQIQAEAAASARGSMLGGEKPIDRIQAEAQAQAAGSMSGNAKPLDRIQSEAQAQAAGTAEGAASKPQYQKLKDEYGNERVFLVDQDTGGLKPVELPGQSGERGGNPFATGKFNDTQGKAAGFSDRMLGSEQTLRKFEGINKDALGATVGAMLPNSMKSEDRQAYEQAKRSFINAQLRRESGAAIAPSEFDSAERQYFPQPGESAPIIEQKRMERQRAIEAMAREGGPAYRPSHVFGEGGALVPFGQRAQQAEGGTQTPAQPSRAQLEAEARRRGLIK